MRLAALLVFLTLAAPAQAAPLSTSIADDGTAAVAWTGWASTQVLVATGRSGALGPLATVEDEGGSVTDVWAVAEPGGGARVVWRAVTAPFEIPQPQPRGVVRSARIAPDGTVTQDGELFETYASRYDSSVQVVADARGDVVVRTDAAAALAVARAPFAALDLGAGRPLTAAVAEDGDVALLVQPSCSGCPAELRVRRAGGEVEPPLALPGSERTVGLSLASDGTAVLGGASALVVRPPGEPFRRVGLGRSTVNALQARPGGAATVLQGRDRGRTFVADVTLDGIAASQEVELGTFAATEDGAAILGLSGGRVAVRPAGGRLGAPEQVGELAGPIPGATVVALSAAGRMAGWMSTTTLDVEGQTLAEREPPAEPDPGPFRGPLRVHGYVLRADRGLGVPISCVAECQGEVRVGGRRRPFYRFGSGGYVWFKRVRARRRLTFVVERNRGEPRTYRRRVVDRRPGCAPPWATAVATGPGTTLRLAESGSGQGLFACGPGRRSRRLARFAVSDRYGGVVFGLGVIDARHAAYTSLGTGEYRDSDVTVIDLRTGRAYGRTLAGTDGFLVRRLAVADDGTLALADWVQGRTRVRIVAADGEDRIADPGPGVDPASLRWDGATLRWTRAGAPQSATA